MTGQQLSGFWLSECSYSTAAIWSFAQLKDRRFAQRKRFSVALERGFANGTIESIEDLVNVYKGIYSLAGDDTSYKGDLARQLRGQLAGLAEGELLPKEKGVLSISAQKAKITEFIKAIETENPFAGLPSAERRASARHARIYSLWESGTSTSQTGWDWWIDSSKA